MSPEGCPRYLIFFETIVRYPIKLFYLVNAVFLVTSFEIGSFNVIFTPTVHNIVISISMLIFLLPLIFSFLNSGKIKDHGLIGNGKFRLFLYTLALLSLYFLINAFIKNCYVTSIKYSVYVLFLIILCVMYKNSQIRIFGKAYICLMVAIASLTIIQCLALSLNDWNLDGYKAINEKFVYSEKKNDFFNDVDYISPYGIGWVRREGFVNYGSLKFIRAIGFSSEPKYYSILLWIAVALTLSYYLQSSLMKYLLLVPLVSALWLSNAYSSIIVVGLTIWVYWLFCIKHLHPNLKSFIVLCIPVMVNVFTTFIPMDIFHGYALQRYESFKYAVPGLEDLNFSGISFLGQGFGESETKLGPSIFLMITRYGVLGFLLYIGMLHLFFKTAFKRVTDKTDDQIKLGISVLISTIAGFFLIFVSQPITLLMCFSLVSLLAISCTDVHRNKIYQELHDFKKN